MRMSGGVTRQEAILSDDILVDNRMGPMYALTALVSENFLFPEKNMFLKTPLACGWEISIFLPNVRIIFR